jgi:hypothetical protein
MPSEVEWVITSADVVTGGDDVIDFGSTWRTPAWLDRMIAWRRGLPRFGLLALAPAALVATLMFGPGIGATTTPADPAQVQTPRTHRTCVTSSTRVVPTVNSVVLVRYDRPVPGGSSCKRPHVPPRR